MPSVNGAPDGASATSPGSAAGRDLAGPRRAFRYPARPSAASRADLEGLRHLYDRYCDHEARGLLGLVPREGLRAMYGRARAALKARAAGSAGEPVRIDSEGQPTSVDGAASAGVVDPEDTMAVLVWYSRELLPLPPYERWLESYLRDRRPFLEALGIAVVPERAEPVLVDVRPVGDGWMAELHLLRTGTEWRGFLCYSYDGPDRSEGPHRTGDIFRGSDPEDFLVRFREFHTATLEAFLRSVRP